MNAKTTALVAILAVSVIAMAGIGYAITYTSTTTSDSNDIEPEYININITETDKKITGMEIALDSKKLAKDDRVYTLPTNIAADDPLPALQQFATMPFTIVVPSLAATDNHVAITTLPVYAAINAVMPEDTGLDLYYKLNNGDWIKAVAGTDSTPNKTAAFSNLGNVTMSSPSQTATLYLAVAYQQGVDALTGGDDGTTGNVAAISAYAGTICLYSQLTDATEDYRPAAS